MGSGRSRSCRRDIQVVLAGRRAAYGLCQKNGASSMRYIRAAPSCSARRKWLASTGVRRRGADFPEVQRMAAAADLPAAV